MSKINRIKPFASNQALVIVLEIKMFIVIAMIHKIKNPRKDDFLFLLLK